MTNIETLKQLYQVVAPVYREALSEAIRTLDEPYITCARTYIPLEDVEKYGLSAALQEACQKLTDVLDCLDSLQPSDLEVTFSSGLMCFYTERLAGDKEIVEMKWHNRHRLDKTLPGDILRRCDEPN